MKHISDPDYFNVASLMDDIKNSWKKEFDAAYFSIWMDQGRIYGSKYWSNRGESVDVELRNATKYEIVIDDILDKLVRILGERRN